MADAPAGLEEIFKRPSAVQAAAPKQGAVTNAPAGLEEIFQRPTLPPQSAHEIVPGFGAAWKGLNDRLKIGGGALNKSVAGWKLATGDMPFEDAKKEVETSDYVNAVADTEADREAHNYGQVAGMTIGQSDVLGGWLAEQIPTLAVAGGGALIGAGVGTAIGATPMAGATVGGALTFGAIMAGQTQYDLMERGVDRDTARGGALVSGAVGTIIGLMGTNALSAGVSKTATGVLTSASFRQAALRTTMQLAKSMGINVSMQEGIAITDAAVKYVATRTSTTEAKPYTVSEATKDVLHGGVQALVLAPQFAAVHGIAGAAGARAKKIQSQIDAATQMHEQLQALAEADLKQAQEKQAMQQQKEAQELAVVKGAQAKKMLRGYVETKDVPSSTEEAKKNVEVAKEALSMASGKLEKTIAQLELEKAQAELKQAILADRLEAVEEALTNPQNGEKLKAKLTEQKARIQRSADKAYLSASELALKKRMAQRTRTISQLKGEISEAQELAKTGEADEVNWKKFSANKARIDTLREQQAIDELLLELFAEKLVKPEEVAFLRPQVPGRRIYGIVKVAQQQVENAAKAGAQEQRETATRVRKLLNAVIEASRLPRADKDSLKTRLVKAQTFDQMEKAVPEILEKVEALFEKRRLLAARADLQALLDKIQPKKTQKSKVPGREEALIAIKEFAEDPEAITRLELNLEEKEVLTPIDEMKMELAALFPDELGNLTAEQIESIINAVVQLQSEGEVEALRRFEEKKQRQESNKAKFWRKATITPQGKRRTSAEQRTVGEKIHQILFPDQWWKAPWRTWEGLMAIVTQLGTVDNLRDIFNLKAMNSKAFGTAHYWRDHFKSLVEEQGLTDKQYAKAFNLETKVSDDLTYVKLSGEGDELVLRSTRLKNPETGGNYTLGELLQIRNYLLDKDLDAVSRLTQGNRYSYPMEVPKGTSTLEVIEEYLQEVAPDLLKVGDAMRQFYKDFHPVVDQAAFQRYGRHVELNDTYGGPLKIDSTGSLGRETFRRVTVRPRSILERVGGGDRVPIRSAFDNLNRHITDFSRELAFIQFEQDAPALFGDEQVKDFITSTYGKGTYHVLEKYIRDIINGPREVENLVSNVMAFFRKNAFTMYLGARPDQFVKQLTGAIHAMQVESVPDVIDGYAYWFANPKKVAEIANKSPLLRARKQLMDPDWKPPKPGSMDEIRNYTMKSVEAGDQVAVFGSAVPSLVKVLRETGSEAKAIEAFERAFETTQGSSAIDEQPHIFRSGAFVRMLTIFTQQANRQVEMISVAWDTYRNNPTKKNFYNFVNTTAVSYLGATLYPLAGWIATAPFMASDKAEERLKEIFAVAPLGPYASLPFWGLVLTPMMVGGFNVAFNEHLGVHEPRALATDILNDFLTDTYAIMKVAKGDTKATYSMIMASANIIGRVTGLPVPSIVKLIVPKEK
jgi:hypothetical protein